MSLFSGILFLIGFVALWVILTVFARRVTAGDAFQDDHETLEEAVEHIKRRLARHRTWWQTGMITGGLALFVVVTGMFYIQNLDHQQEQDRLANRCEFRTFIVDFFDQLNEDGFQSDELAAVPGFSELGEAERVFLIALADAAANRQITIEEARADYISQFPLEGCD